MAGHIDIEGCGSLGLVNFHSLCQHAAFEDFILFYSFFPNCQHFKLSFGPTSHMASFHRICAHHKQIFCRLNYAFSYPCTTSLLSDDVCGDTCAIPLAFQCSRSLSPQAVSEANGISLLRRRMKVARQHFCSW